MLACVFVFMDVVTPLRVAVAGQWIMYTFAPGEHRHNFMCKNKSVLIRGSGSDVTTVRGSMVFEQCRVCISGLTLCAKKASMKRCAGCKFTDVVFDLGGVSLIICDNSAVRMDQCAAPSTAVTTSTLTATDCCFGRPANLRRQHRDIEHVHADGRVQLGHQYGHRLPHHVPVRGHVCRATGARGLACVSGALRCRRGGNVYY